jgi:dephospho-CoA kinase
MELLRNLRRKIEALEKEKAGLLVEIESLKEKGEANARELENEVGMLGKEVKALEKLLNVKEKIRNKEIQSEDSS